MTDEKLMQLEEFSKVDRLTVLANEDGSMDELLAAIGNEDMDT